MQIKSDTSFKAIKLLEDSLNSYIQEAQKRKEESLSKEKYIEETITGLSHDIRTPLTSLDGYLQLLEREGTEEEKKQYLCIMGKRLDSLHRILEELFTFVKIRQEAYTLSMEQVDIKRIALETLFSFYHDFSSKGFVPDVSLPDEEIWIESNQEALERVFQNIYKNILEHGQSPLFIRMKKQENELYFLSQNKIPKNIDLQEEDIFKQFYKGRKERSGSSTGLGLSIAKGLVEKLGGSMEAHIKEDTFVLEIIFSLEERR